jgi:cyclophilin family peptidyl-prolyl cis-trans isomerase
MNLLKAICLTICVLSSGSLFAQTSTVPAAPSDLKVTPVGVNAFILEWKDNSDNESGWDIRISLGKTDNAAHYTFLNARDISSYTVITNELPGKTLTFQIAAYNGSTGAEVTSEPTPPVTVVALSPSRFGAPTNLKATSGDAIILEWDDNSTAERGYIVEIKEAEGEWQFLYAIDPGTDFRLVVPVKKTKTPYTFRTRAYRGTPPAASYTKYSNEASATCSDFQKPTDLAAKAEADGGISLTWKDHSVIEEGYEIQSKSGTSDFTSLGTVPANSTSTGVIPNFSFDTEYQLRIRGFRTEETSRVYTDFSNVTTVTTGKLAKPRNLTGETINDTSVHLAWKDVSGRESAYQIQARAEGKSIFETIAEVDANTKDFTASELKVGTTYAFRVRARDLFGGAYSAFSTSCTLTTKDGIRSDLNPPIFWNSNFGQQIDCSEKSRQVASITVSNLPAGLSYDPAKRRISGSTRAEGVRKVGLKVNYSDGGSISRQLVLRIIRPPAAPVPKGTLDTVTIAAGASTTVSIDGKFADPDTVDARHVSTTMGDFDIILYPLATPLTVANFLSYADNGKYTNTFFHRSVADFVVQTGGYRYDTAHGYRLVTPSVAVRNEPGISNLKGTLAMAKIGGDPNSATCEYFVNISDDNADNLDFQNGGFTVFGRVAGNGMSVINPINALPVGSYSVTIGGAAKSLDDVPVNAASAPTTLDPEQLVKVKSVTKAPILRYEVSSEDESVAKVKLTGTDLKINGVTAGTTRILIKAIDLDGQSLTRRMSLKVN